MQLFVMDNLTLDRYSLIYCDYQITKSGQNMALVHRFQLVFSLLIKVS